MCSYSRHLMTRCFYLAIMAGVFALVSHNVWADGIPQAWGINLQDAGSPIAERIGSFHDFLLWIITFVSLFVLALLVIVVVRYNRGANPNASHTTHNVKLEIIWTLFPCFVLLAIAFYSFPLLYYADRTSKVDMTVKVTGHQWYWSYEYPDQGDISFDSHAIWDSSDVTAEQAAKLIKDAQSGWLIQSTPLRLLEVDNRLVLPVGKNVRVQITATDVEHSWYVSSLGVNRMAVPGHLSEVWVRVNKEGLYYGQCSMICGNGHGYMPIVIEGVSPDKFDAWVKSKKTSVGQIESLQKVVTTR